MITNANVALRLAEAFARHGVIVTFGQSLPSAFHLAHHMPESGKRLTGRKTPVVRWRMAMPGSRAGSVW
jgi:hypothetical protein